MSLNNSTPTSAHKIRKSEIAGVGALVQLLGVAAAGYFFFFFSLASAVAGYIIGAVVLVICLAVGSSLSFKYLCSNCGNRVEKTAKLCPTCKAPLS